MPGEDFGRNEGQKSTSASNVPIRLTAAFASGDSIRPFRRAETAAMRYGFFRRFRDISVGAYFSLEQNWPEIGYMGNKPQESFPPPTDEEMAFINAAIAKLGL